MTRRIFDFRAWNSREEQFVYHIQRCIKVPTDMFMCQKCFMDYLSDPECIVEEDTGVIDKNGHHIYEGDIVSGLAMDSFKFTGEIVREKNYFAVKMRNKKVLTKLSTYHLEIIGNIHEKEKLKERRKKRLAPKRAIKE